jgi:WD40 repeat protein
MVPVSPSARCNELPAVTGYQLRREVGRGGMGVVYEAWQTGLRRTVALKMILAGGHAGAEELARFHTEAEAAARLQHANIVQIHEVGEHEGRPYFALEFVDGGSLSQKLVGTPLPARQAAGLVTTLAQAMHYAHQKGVVHRDLTPANILLTADGTPKITDFGLAKLLIGGSGKTQTGAILGTPSYMAPEQAEGKKSIGPAADVYALGAILYEALTGRPPHRAETPLDTVLQVLSEDPVPPSRLQPRVGRNLETICLKCLQRDPRKRYASATDLADDLQRYLDDRPIVARRAGRAERAWRWRRRHPGVAGMLAFVLLLLLVLAVGASTAAVWLNERRNEALTNLGRAEKAEKAATQSADEAQDQLWASRLAQARAGRWSGKVGRRFDSLDALAGAARLRFGPELRDEAIACMTLVDLRLVRRFPSGQTLTLDPDGRRYAQADDQGNIRIRRIEDDAEVCQLPSPGIPSVGWTFSPDGRFLMVRYEQGKNAARFQVWDLARATTVWKEPVRDPTLVATFNPSSRLMAILHTDGVLSVYDLATGKETGRWAAGTRVDVLAFSPDSKALAVARSDGSISIFDPATGKEVKRMVGGQQPRALVFHPSRHQFALARFTQAVEVYDWDSGRLIQTLPHPGIVRDVAWSPDGKQLATACSDFQAYVWDATTSDRPPLALRGHSSEVTGVRFNHRGNLLITNGWDLTCRLWDPRTGKEQVNLPGDHLGFSRDDQFLFVAENGTCVYRVDPALECRALHAHEDVGKGPWNAAFNPDGRLLASASGDGVVLWDVAGASPSAFLPVGVGTLGAKLDRGDSTAAVFLPSGDLVTSGPYGLHRWPAVADPRTPGSLRLGPAQSLNAQGSFRRVARSRDGHTLAAINAFAQVAVVNTRDGTQKLLLHAPPDVEYVAVAPEGLWIATSSRATTGVRIWDGHSGRPLHTLKEGSGCIAFSPDGRWLAAASQEGQCLWQTGTWARGHCMKVEHQGGSLPLAFSEDGKLFAVCSSQSIVDLYDTTTGNRLARLEPPESRLLPTWFCFSADSAQLAVATENHVVYLWDLRRIRKRLDEMQLARDWPEYSAAPVDAAPLRVEVLPGGLPGRPAGGAPQDAVVEVPPVPKRTATDEQVAGWVKALIEDRPEADADAKRLEEVGAPARKTLADAASKAKPEIRGRLEAILDRIDLREALAPTPINLRLKNASVAEAVSALAKQSPIELQYRPAFRSRVGTAGEPKRITLDLESVPFWEALDRLCQAAGLSYGSAGYALRLVETSMDERPRVAYHGPCCLQVGSLTYSRNLYALGPSPQVSEQLMLNLAAFCEPHLPVSGHGQPRVTEATDDTGRSLMPAEGPDYINHYYNPVYPAQALQMMLPLRAPPKLGGKLKTLKGRLPLEVMVGRRPLLTVDDVANASGKTFHGEDDLRLTVRNVQANNSQVTLELTWNSKKNLERDTHDLMLTDAEGRRYGGGGSSFILGRQNETTTRFWAGWPGIGPPAKLTLYHYKRVRTEVPFEFHDLPLP